MAKRKHGVLTCKVCDGIVTYLCTCYEHQRDYYSEVLCREHDQLEQERRRNIKNQLRIEEK